jgi:hypothetical protein
MHGLLFVTWEKYISERFGHQLLQTYRIFIGETAATAPLVSRVYSDEVFIIGVQALCRLTGLNVNTILHEYGRYFITNGLTSHLCAYLLTRVQSGRDLLLIMREGHAQMRRTSDGLTPPLFSYETSTVHPKGLVLLYDSPRKLCSVLLGAIEGAGERYGEQVNIIERSCMRYGASICRFEASFQTPVTSHLRQRELEELHARRKEKQLLADFVLTQLPYQQGTTLTELQLQLRLGTTAAHPERFRPHLILEALRHLQHAGLVASTANQPGDTLANRRYWRAPTIAT